MNITILLAYYNRPKLVQNALKSILDANQYYTNWNLLFGDDGSPVAGEPIARDILKDHLDKVSFVNSHMSLHEKLQNGMAIGKFANQYLDSIETDIVITLCDDDMLYPEYLLNLSLFFQKNKNCMYCYSDVIIYNPLMPGQPTRNCFYNRHLNGNPSNKLDASQVAFRMECFKQGCRFPETTTIDSMPYLANIDAGLYQQLHDKFGEPFYTNFISQYKGIHEHQMVWHKKQDSIGLHNHIKKVDALAGIEL